jgi:hypothetical protein
MTTTPPIILSRPAKVEGGKSAGDSRVEVHLRHFGGFFPSLAILVYRAPLRLRSPEAGDQNNNSIHEP